MSKISEEVISCGGLLGRMPRPEVWGGRSPSPPRAFGSGYRNPERVAYVVATYCGKNHTSNRELAAAVLTISMNELIVLLRAKKDAGVVSMITHVVMVMPPVSIENQLPYYYRLDPWAAALLELGVIFVPFEYTGANRHHSYDQWIQGCMRDEVKDVTHFILTEDDYCLNREFLTCDTDLLKEYKRLFPDDVGYMASYGADDATFNETGKTFPQFTFPPVIASVSNGIISKKTWMRFKEPLQFFYTVPVVYPQLKFSYMFLVDGIDIKDFRASFGCPFWNSLTQAMEDYTMYDGVAKPVPILPVQTTSVLARYVFKRGVDTCG